MTGQHRSPRPSLLVRIGERLSHIGDRRIRAAAGDPGWETTSRGPGEHVQGRRPGPEPPRVAPPPPPPMAPRFRRRIVLDHPHRLDQLGVCEDVRCQYRAADNPATQTVVDVPAGEPEFRTWRGPEATA